MKNALSAFLIVLAIFACAEDEILEESLNQDVEIPDLDSQENSSAEMICFFDEPMATFPGGKSAWFEYLRSNLSFPHQAERMGVEGAVFVSFVVNEVGEVSDVRVVRGIGAGCDEEAVKVLLASPKWIPAKLHGQVVKSKMSIRIVFKQS
jgi:protein TonB